jgi:hypothetical protein
VSDLGIKVYLKKIKYGELRDETIKFHLTIEAKMLKNYAQILMAVLTDGSDSLGLDPDSALVNLEIEPELKALLYECIHAEDKIQQSEQESYDNEINAFILQEKIARMKTE